MKGKNEFGGFSGERSFKNETNCKKISVPNKLVDMNIIG